MIAFQSLQSEELPQIDFASKSNIDPCKLDLEHAATKVMHTSKHSCPALSLASVSHTTGETHMSMTCTLAPPKPKDCP
jgi:hypothetical protein